MADAKQLYAEREQRARTCVSLQEADRVPFVPKIGRFYSTGYNISTYDVMMDKRNILPGIEAFVRDYEPDLGWVPVEHNIPSVKATGANFLKWPGPDFGIPKRESFQVLDGSFIRDDEFEEFVLDPTHFFLTKFYPRKFDKLKGLAKIDSLRMPFEYGIYGMMAAFGDPEVRASLQALMEASTGAREWQQYSGMCAGKFIEMGVPVGCAVATTCAFDEFSDNVRGLLNTIMDIYERPDELLAVLDTIERYSIEPAVMGAKAMGIEYFFIPLHAGVDEFMSPENYAKFYWPGLKKLMTRLIEEGITPYVFCEGRYNTRLEQLLDVPKGKVIYMFETVDIKRAKEVLGGHACICGNLPTALLAHGTPEQVKDATKKMLDDCAPGGGFMMDASIVIDDVKHENLQAMRETTLIYGKY